MLTFDRIGKRHAKSARATRGLASVVPAAERAGRVQVRQILNARHRQATPTVQGVVQRAPADTIEVTIVEVSRSESDLLFHDYGIRLPGSPPSVVFGGDAPIPESSRRMVQMGFDLAFATAASSSFVARLGEFKGSMGKRAEENIPGVSGLSQQKYLSALSRMVIHLADTSKNPLVRKTLLEETGKSAGPPTAGFTPIGGNDVYVRGFAVAEGRDALASLILHEAFHVAGVPAKPINQILEYLMEAAVHGFEATVGLPLSNIALKAASILAAETHGHGLAFTVSVTEPDQLSADPIRVEILDGNRNLVFSQERPRRKFSERFVWDGLDSLGKPTESGMHSIRLVAGSALFAARDYIVRRAKQ